MGIKTSLSLIMTVIFLAGFGILSIYKPQIIGAEFYWSKYKMIYIPKYRKTRNEHYLNYIKIMGWGLISAAAILLAVWAIPTFNL